MGIRYRPGSTSRSGSGSPLDDPALDPRGRGTFDPDTGLWDWYEGEEGDTEESGDPIPWPELLARWDRIVPDFASEYGIDLHREFQSMPWVRFRYLVFGLLSADTRLSRYFRRDDDKRDPTKVGDE